ncbi:hypothetical protein GOV04_02250 [Candidatus Woesearchaeota archaeon]|nr:hypothetical protein [Candidatus Woesearchaeota archaeon]
MKKLSIILLALALALVMTIPAMAAMTQDMIRGPTASGTALLTAQEALDIGMSAEISRDMIAPSYEAINPLVKEVVLAEEEILDTGRIQATLEVLSPVTEVFFASGSDVIAIDGLLYGALPQATSEVLPACTLAVNTLRNVMAGTAEMAFDTS